MLVSPAKGRGFYDILSASCNPQEINGFWLIDAATLPGQTCCPDKPTTTTQNHKPPYSPVHRDPPAPAVKTMSPQQHCEHPPRYKTEQDFVIELPGLAEYFFGEHHAGCQRQRQQHETDAYHAKQQGFHGHQRRQTAQYARQRDRKSTR